MRSGFSLTELLIGTLVLAVLALPLLDLVRTNRAQADAGARETRLTTEALAALGDEAARLAAGEAPTPGLTTPASVPGLFEIQVEREGVRVTALVPDRELGFRSPLVAAEGGAR